MASKQAAPVQEGMGAIVHQGGVAFRVWAPNAGSVFVKGDFNDWSDEATALSQEEHGTWYADVASAKPGQEYKFVLLNGDQKLERIDPYARQVTNSTGNGVIYDAASFDWQQDNFELPAHNELAIYEMHIGSFFTSEAGKPGGFETALEKLGEVKRLGVNAVQIMPVAEFAGDYSWGYNPAQIFAVESSYGGPDCLKMFVREAHKLGLAVILDVVYNHFGPSDLDLWQFDGWRENEKGGIYFYNDQRAETPWGSTRPDYGRQEVRNFIHDNARMWLEEFHVDGLRYDSTLFIRTIDGDEANPLPEGWSLMQQINGDIRARFAHTILIAEDLRNNPWITKPTEENGAGFHAQWDANFVHPVRAVITLIQDEQRTMETIRQAILFNYEGDAFRRVVYSELHDEVANGRARVPQEINPGDPGGWHAQKRSTLAAGLVFTSPGIPMLFQGQEFLQGEWFRDNVPLDWDRNEQYQGLVRLYRDLIQLRLNTRGCSRGLCGQFTNIYHLNEADNILAFQRWDQHGLGGDVVVVLNFSNSPKQNYEIGLPAPGLWKLRLNSDATIYSNDFQGFFSADVKAIAVARDGLDACGTISIGPYSMLIFSQDVGPQS